MSRPRTLDRQPTRDEPRLPTDRAVARDREGNPIFRQSVGDRDRYYVDPKMIEAGWVYEWKRHTIFNMPDPSYEADLHANGWRPVPSTRHPGFKTPMGFDGPIILDGLILMERPKSLNDEEREAARKAARQAVSNSKRQHGLGIGDQEGRVELVKRKDISFVNEAGISVTMDDGDV